MPILRGHDLLALEMFMAALRIYAFMLTWTLMSIPGYAGDLIATPKSKVLKILEDYQQKEVEYTKELVGENFQELSLKAMREVIGMRSALVVLGGIDKALKEIEGRVIGSSQALERFKTLPKIYNIAKEDYEVSRRIEFLLRYFKSSLHRRDPDSHEKYINMLITWLEKTVQMKFPTVYEEPLIYLVLTEISRKIEDAIKEFSREIPTFPPLPTSPLLGTLNSGRVNAMLFCDRNEYLIIFQRELFHFANLFSKIVVTAMPIKEDEKGYIKLSVNQSDWQKNIAENTDILDRFQDVLFAYLFRGAPGRARAYLVPPYYGDIAAIMVDAMERFVMGHEYGHILFRHFPECDTERGFDERGIKEVDYNHDHEIIADKIGVHLMVKSILEDNYDIAISLAGVDLFLYCIELVERSISVVRHGHPDDRPRRTHPPPDKRRQTVYNTFNKEIFSQGKWREEAKAAEELGQSLQQIIEDLWQRTQPALVQYPCVST